MTARKTTNGGCPARNGGFACTRTRRHKGRHQAKDIYGITVSSWAQRPKASSTR